LKPTQKSESLGLYGGIFFAVNGVCGIWRGALSEKTSREDVCRARGDAIELEQISGVSCIQSSNIDA
jgi:hypothetical protein